MNELTNQSSDSEIFCPEERIKELELRLITFSQREDEVVFRMPQRTKELDLISPFEKVKFKAFFVESLKVIFDEKKPGNSKEVSLDDSWRKI
ncbi:hypothetical protein Tco_0524691 [Tanacetum coccineum]